MIWQCTTKGSVPIEPVSIIEPVPPIQPVRPCWKIVETGTQPGRNAGTAAAGY